MDHCSARSVAENLLMIPGTAALEVFAFRIAVFDKPLSEYVALLILDAHRISALEGAFDPDDAAGKQAGALRERLRTAGIDHQLAPHAHTAAKPRLARTVLAARQENRAAILLERLADRRIMGAVDDRKRYPGTFGDFRGLELRNHSARPHARTRAG